LPQQNISPLVEPLHFEHQRVTVGDKVIETALFNVHYDYGARLFRGYALVDGQIQRAECALKPHEAACAVSGWVHGWISGAQRTKLFHLAQECPKGQIIVEIGSWKGKSTAILGWGSKAGQKMLVWAIDPHEATPAYWIIHNGGEPQSSYPQFAANLNAGGLLDVVMPLTMPSQQAASILREPVGVLFIDGDHHYAALDVTLWASHVVLGGWIALHDINMSYVQTALALLQETGQFGAVETVDSMVVCQRVVEGVVP
jgi:predicted O-methyltransferase YrrM